MNATKDDRRGAARQVLRTKAQLLFREGLLLDARTLNFSNGGMAIVTDSPIAPGTTFALRGSLPVAGSKVELVDAGRRLSQVLLPGGLGNTPSRRAARQVVGTMCAPECGEAVTPAACLGQHDPVRA